MSSKSHNFGDVVLTSIGTSTEVPQFSRPFYFHDIILDKAHLRQS